MTNAEAMELIRWAVLSTQAFNEEKRYDRDMTPKCIRAQMAAEHIERLLKDFDDAAGELLVDLPEPGTVTAKLLAANAILRRERGPSDVQIGFAADKIMKDLSDRAGFDHIIDSLDDDAMKEISSAWLEILQKELGRG